MGPTIFLRPALPPDLLNHSQEGTPGGPTKAWPLGGHLVPQHLHLWGLCRSLGQYLLLAYLPCTVASACLVSQFSTTGACSILKHLSEARIWA